MRRSKRALLTLVLAGGTAGAVTAGVLAGPAAAGTSPAVVSPLDGPGSYYVFRTLDSGQKPPAAQDAACNSTFGFPRSLTVVQRLDARLYSFTSDQHTGFLTNQTAQLLGPGYLCVAPGISGSHLLEGFANTSLPGVGSTDLHGSCGVQPLVAQLGTGVVDCDLTVAPNGVVTGGVATSSSVANPLNLSGAPTGSVWTIYVTGGTSSSVPAPVSGGKPDTGNTHFTVDREVNGTAGPATAACPGGQHVTELHPVQTDPATSKVIGQPSASVAGTATVCYGKPAAPDFPATLTLTVSGVSPALTVTSSGHCRQQTVPGVTVGVQQSCAFALPLNQSRGLNGGIVTSSGVVQASTPGTALNSAVWSVSMLGTISPS